MNNEQPGSLGSSDYHVERLDDVRERLSRLEGKTESFATKEDIANAKVSMVTLYVTVGVLVLSVIAGLAIRFWPT